MSGSRARRRPARSAGGTAACRWPAGARTACRGTAPVRSAPRSPAETPPRRAAAPASRPSVWTSRWLPAERGHVPAPAVGRQPAHVLVREQRERRIGRAPRRRTDRVADRGPVRAVVGGDLEAVGRGDHGGVARGRRCPPGSRTATPAPAGRRSSSARSAPPSSERPQPLPTVPYQISPLRAEGDGLHEVHRDRASAVVSWRMDSQALGARRETVDPLPVGADPERAARDRARP